MLNWSLVGNPNCGKSTLFNRLTGANQHVGNWPGVTVEKVSGHCQHQQQSITVTDLPGLYALADKEAEFADDEKIAQHEILAQTADVYINVVDGSSLARHLFLTSQLIEQGLNIVVAVNMMDNVQQQGLSLNLARLSELLGVPVVGISSSRGEGLEALLDTAIKATKLSDNAIQQPATHSINSVSEHYQRVEAWLDQVLTTSNNQQTITDKIDHWVLHPWLGLPIFLAVVYLIFMFSINVGSAFIDVFDQLAGLMFVEIPAVLLAKIGAPDWLSLIVADGLGGGVQLVLSFVPVIGAMFLILAWLEDSGYLARAAFVVDRMTRYLGLPGKAFIPLIVGFGCNVPSVMATRTLSNERDRITAMMMTPFMSCGARLTVYALFAAAFFPSGGHNMVFALYIIGIVVAVLSAFAMKKTLLQGESGHFVLELPNYHLPLARNIMLRTWHRLRGFVIRAGKAIVVVVVILNVLNSVGADGTVGNQDSEDSVLSSIGKTITPIFKPMGIEAHNWPATVGIFTGIFAKEVVVGTLDNLYSPSTTVTDDTFEPLQTAIDALATVPENLLALGEQLLDPLGLAAISGETNLEAAAAAQSVQSHTLVALQQGFGSVAAAFAYLLFVLLYIPCVATVGAMFREVNWQWSVFIVVWSLGCGYGVAVGFYQMATFNEHPLASITWLLSINTLIGLTIVGLRRYATLSEAKRSHIIASAK